MTEILEAQQTEQPKRIKAVRQIDAEIAIDGRIGSFRIAPFGEYAISADGLGFSPKGVPYKEELMPGLYDRQLRAANRILLNFEHEEGINGVVGDGRTLTRRDDGYHMDFEFHETQAGEKALLLAKRGILQGASVESYWLKSDRGPGGIVRRILGRLVNVAICREGAYAGAVLTGLRTDEFGDEIEIDPELLIVPVEQEKFARAQAVGVRLPERFEAHPVDAGTPAEPGTPEDGTRQADPTTSTEVQE